MNLILHEVFRKRVFGELRGKDPRGKIVEILGEPLEISVSKKPEVLKWDALQIAVWKNEGLESVHLNVGTDNWPVCLGADLPLSANTTFAQIDQYCQKHRVPLEHQAHYDADDTTHYKTPSGATLIFEKKKLRGIHQFLSLRGM